jgi:hypothetical protein
MRKTAQEVEYVEVRKKIYEKIMRFEKEELYWINLPS